MTNLGFHISVKDGLLNGIKYAHTIGKCKYMQMFAGNNRSTTLASKTSYSPTDIAEIATYIKLHDIGLVIHGVYVVNLCAATGKIQKCNNVLHDLDLAAKFGAIGVVVHLGSATDQDLVSAIANFTENVEYICANMPAKVKLILETNYGGGKQIGVSVTEFHALYMGIAAKWRRRIAICIDTAHIFAAGYEIRDYFTEFGATFGSMDIVELIHLNDNPHQCGSHRDIHAPIGDGKIFDKTLIKWLLTTFNTIPCILETDGAGYIGSTYPDQIEKIRKTLAT